MDQNKLTTPADESPALSDTMIGQTFGVYKIVREIGRGGMGLVYLAERIDGAFRQNAAIKILKRGVDTDSILKRFRNERQILAALNHPNIVLLYDGGTTENGLPYFVMEYVTGEPLYKFCDSRKLNITERLKIFVQICDAVNAAHQIKVVHRDLKPSNILVKDDGTPKLLDFGIAKLLDPELADATLEPTATNVQIMTPEYASPEQVTHGEITPASDVYSLGVLLYELLSGHRPYRFKNRSPHEIARVICEEPPDRPSTGVTRDDNLISIEKTGEPIASQDIGVLRSAENLESLQKQLSGDLEKVILKCLQKEPKKRYQSAAELAADISRYLAGESVLAEAFYVASSKSRKSESVAEAQSLAVLPLKFLSQATAREEGEDFLGVGLADALVSRLSGMKRLVVRPTSSVLPLVNLNPLDAGKKVDVNYVLDGTIRRIGERIRVNVQLLNVAQGSTVWAQKFDEEYTNVLELEDSISERAAQSLLPQLTGEEKKILDKRGTDSHEAYEAYLRGRAYFNILSEDGFARSINFYRQAVEHDPNYAQAWIAIAEYYIFLGIHCFIPFNESIIATREAAEKVVRLDPMLAEGYATLGFVASGYEFAWSEAEELFQKALKLNPNSLMANFWYAALFAQTGRFEEALKLIEHVLEFDSSSLLAIHMRAWVLYHAREFSQSAELHQKMLRNEPNYAWGIQGYSWSLRKLRRFDEAIEQALRAVQLTNRNPVYLCTLASAYADAGQKAKALQTLSELKEISKTRYVSEYMLAHVYCALEDKEKAFEMLEKSLAGRDDWMRWLAVDPQFDILRGDPRYNSLLRRTKNPLAKSLESNFNLGKVTAERLNEKQSIAVLPLKIIGKSSSEEEYLSFGLADAMITRLSKVSRLAVRPTSAVLRFSETDDAINAGRELQTDFVLSGTVRRAGNRLRISAQLVNVNSENTIWADKFDEDLTDILELEDKVAEKVGKVLIPRLSGEEQKKLVKRETNNAQAFDAYIHARYHLFLLTPESAVKAKAFFEEAIRLDSDYALAYVGLAELYFALNTFGTMPPSIAYPQARELSERAIEIDDSLGEAYAVLAVTYHDNYDFVQMESYLRRSIELNPNYPLSRIWMANVLTFYGKHDEAIKEAEYAVKLNPVSTFEKRQLAWIYSHNHRLNKALEISEATVKAEPGNTQCLTFYSRILRLCGRFDDSLKMAERAVKFDNQTPLIVTNYAASLAAVGEKEKAQAVLQKLENLPAEIYVSPFNMAIAYINLGDIEQTYIWLEYGYQTRDQRLTWIVTEPQFDELRNEPRFQKLVELLKHSAVR